MPNPTFRRWAADDIVKLKNFTQMQRGEIEQLGQAANAAQPGGTNESKRQHEGAQAQG
jgi:hypothetical protein